MGLASVFLGDCLSRWSVVCKTHLCVSRTYFSPSTTTNLVHLSSRSRKRGRVPSRSISTGFLRGSRLSLLGGDSSLLEASQAAEEDCGDVAVVPGFVTASEGESLLREIDLTLRGKCYLYNHWDGAIEGYRETERERWREENVSVIQRLRETAELAGGERVAALDEVHVLDLAKDGYIRPHIDSVKFCGDVIAGLSLVSECVMVFEHEDCSDRWIRALLPPLSSTS